MRHMENVLARCGPYGPTYGPDEEVPFSSIFVCERGTVLIPVGVQLPKGEGFPEVAGLGEHTRFDSPEPSSFGSVSGRSQS